MPYYRLNSGVTVEIPEEKATRLGLRPVEESKPTRRTTRKKAAESDEE